MVGLLARRLTGKYIAPKSEHLEKRVEEIHEASLRYDREDHAEADHRDAGTLQQQRNREVGGRKTCMHHIQKI